MTSRINRTQSSAAATTPPQPAPRAQSPQPAPAHDGVVRSLLADPGYGIGAAVGGTLITRNARDRALLLTAGVAAELVLVAIALLIAALSGAPGVGHGTSAITGGAFGPAVTDALAAVLALAIAAPPPAPRWPAACWRSPRCSPGP